MNDWYELTQSLETEVSPLDELTQTRIDSRIQAALPRRRNKPQLIAVIAAILILTACGYAAISGQFSDWFWNVSDFNEPNTDEDLLASMGTILDQSQTVDGNTITLHGALWDGKTLMLSATIESDKIPNDAWRTVESETSWLHASRETVRKNWQELYSDRFGPDVFEENLTAMLEMMHKYYKPQITYLYNQHTGAYYLQIEIEYSSSQDLQEMELHLENLHFTGMSEPLKGPFDFTFSIERRYPEVIYEGSAILHQENGIDLEITQVILTPLNMNLLFEVPQTMSKDQFHDTWNISEPNQLKIGDEILFVSTSSGWTGKHDDNGNVSGSFHRGPFERVVDPKAVDAIGINEFFLELDTFTLVPQP